MRMTNLISMAQINVSSIFGNYLKKENVEKDLTRSDLEIFHPYDLTFDLIDFIVTIK